MFKGTEHEGDFGSFKIETDVPLSGKKVINQYTKTAGLMIFGSSVFFKTKKEATKQCRALRDIHKPATYREVDRGYRVWCIDKKRKAESTSSQHPRKEKE